MKLTLKKGDRIIHKNNRDIFFIVKRIVEKIGSKKVFVAVMNKAYKDPFYIGVDWELEIKDEDMKDWNYYA